MILPPVNMAEDKPPPVASPGDPFAELLPIDVDAIQRGADAFFEKLARLSEEWKGARTIHELTPWLLVTGLVAYEWLRLQRMRSSYPVGPNEDSDIEPALFLMGDEG
ncbi:MAG TPA: hypothetical protein VMG10_01925 [Gemmataceae bacterium]|nr:hypothetical protein [Gemmataceae bacterium]